MATVRDLYIDYAAACWAYDHPEGKNAEQLVADRLWHDEACDAYWSARLRADPRYAPEPFAE